MSHQGVGHGLGERFIEKWLYNIIYVIIKEPKFITFLITFIYIALVLNMNQKMLFKKQNVCACMQACRPNLPWLWAECFWMSISSLQCHLGWDGCWIRECWGACKLPGRETHTHNMHVYIYIGGPRLTWLYVWDCGSNSTQKEYRPVHLGYGTQDHLAVRWLRYPLNHSASCGHPLTT